LYKNGPKKTLRDLKQTKQKCNEKVNNSSRYLMTVHKSSSAESLECLSV